VTLSLDALSPERIIERGYSIVRRASDRSIITHVAQVQPGDELAIQVADGQISARAMAD
jgi:exodeoxyribonuclease VII large subunit